MIRIPACALAASACIALPPALAQPTADPLDPKAPVRPAIHESPLPARPQAAASGPIPWRAANEHVRHIGGWRVYAREAASPATPASAPAPHHPGSTR
jgi:hypothetical protein